MDLTGLTCEWCEDDAKVAVPVLKRKGGVTLPSGMHMYACWKHKGTAERIVQEKIAPQQRKV